MVGRVALRDRADQRSAPTDVVVPAAGRQPLIIGTSHAAGQRPALPEPRKEGPLFSGPSAFSRRVSWVHQAAGFSPVASVVMRIFTSSLTFGA